MCESRFNFHSSALGALGRLGLAIVLFGVISACGGGGSSGILVADAGTDRTVNEGNTVDLNGSASDDPNGVIVSYLWEQISGTSIALSDANTPIASFTAPAVTAADLVLEFRLTVTDNDNETATDTVIITVQNFVPITLSGAVTFDRVMHDAGSNGLNYNTIVSNPARGIPVQAIDFFDSNTVFAEGGSDENGEYSFTVPGNTTMFVRARVEMIESGIPSWDFSVVDNTNNQALYVLDGASFTTGVTDRTRNLHAASGWTGSDYTQSRSAAPFAILDSVYAAFQKVLAVDPGILFPPLLINWSINNEPADGDPSLGQIGTSFYSPSEVQIYILGAKNSDTDEYDDHVVIHEWGHYFEDNFSRSDSIGGAHSVGDRLDMRLAFGEGWGNAWSGIATDDSNYQDAFGIQQAQGFSIDVDENLVTNPGWYNESSIQSVLYDLYDSNDDGADTLSLGFAPLYEVLTAEQASTPALTSIFPFIEALKANNPTDSAAIDALLAAQNIVSNGNDAWGSAETNNAGNALDVLPVYTTLTVNGSAANVCSLSQYGVYNKLSVRRFLRFTVTSAGLHQIVASNGPSGSDPDLVLYQQEVIASSLSGVSGQETLNVSLNPGEYVLEVYEFSNLTSAPRGRACFDLAVTD